MKLTLFTTIIFSTLILFSSCGPSAEEKAAKEKAKKYSLEFDSIAKKDSLASDSIAKATSLGIWRVGFFVDEFGDPTNEKYISNSNSIEGDFSNSATTGSALNVDLITDNKGIITIQLFEYAGKNPVKHCIEKYYKIKVKDINGNSVSLTATNISDRLSLNKADSKILSDLLLKGSKLQFSIIEVSNYSASSYKFVINDPSGYDNAIKKLNE